MESPVMRRMQPPSDPPPAAAGRPPRMVRPGLWLFAPNRDSQGGSAWLLESQALDVLVDLPALSPAESDWLQQRARLRPGWIVLTGRQGHGRCRVLQRQLGWPVLVQEQEAYLLPDLPACHTFAAERQLAEGLRLLWTPGPTPGACVLHASGAAAGDGLFCGRLLVPLGPDRLGPLRRPGTFHWFRQLASLEQLRRWLPPGSPDWIASGAALGGLRGAALVGSGAALLARLDLQALRQQPVEGM